MFFRITDRYYTVRAQLTRQCANIVLLVQISLALDFADSGNRTQMLWIWAAEENQTTAMKQEFHEAEKYNISQTWRKTYTSAMKNTWTHVDSL